MISWAAMPEAAGPVTRLGETAVGLGLEYAMQLHSRPVANAARRTSLGGWRPIDRLRSKSVGARSSAEITELVTAVEGL